MDWRYFWGNPFYCGLFFLNSLVVSAGIIWLSLSVLFAVIEDEDNYISDTKTTASYKDSDNFLIYCIITQIICLALLVNCIVGGYYFGLFKANAEAIRIYCIILIVIGGVSAIMGGAMCFVLPKGKKAFILESFQNYTTREKFIKGIVDKYKCCSPIAEVDKLVYFKECNRNRYRDCHDEVYLIYIKYGVWQASAAFTLTFLPIFTAVWGCYLARMFKKEEQQHSGQGDVRPS